MLFRISLPVVIILISSCVSFGEILVEPSYIEGKNIRPGKITNVFGSKDRFLKIINTSETPAVYKISLISCKEYNISPNPDFMDIPDITWFPTRTYRISLQPGEIGYIRDILVVIPKKAKNYTQSWQSIVKIEKELQINETINYEVILPLWIYTERRDFTFFRKLLSSLGLI